MTTRRVRHFLGSIWPCGKKNRTGDFPIVEVATARAIIGPSKALFNDRGIISDQKPVSGPLARVGAFL